MWQKDLQGALERAQARILALEREVEESGRRLDSLRDEQERRARREADRLAGIAHDISGAMAVILCCSRRLKDADPEELRAHAEAIEESAEHGEALSKRLGDLGRRTPTRADGVALNDGIRSVDRLLRRLLGDERRLVIKLSPGLGQVSLARADLERILLNLVANARDATPAGGTVTIETRSALRLTRGRAAPRRRGGALLTIRDTGDGMPPAVLERVFEPGFTTKAPDGSGLGLANVRRIVERAGGHVAVRSAPGEGTTLRLFLPSAWTP